MMRYYTRLDYTKITSKRKSLITLRDSSVNFRVEIMCRDTQTSENLLPEDEDELVALR